MSKLKPKYQHDCSACQFLGQYVRDGHTHDLYHCSADWTGSTLIWRFADQGSAYGSHPTKVLQYLFKQHPEVACGHPGAIALKLAQRKGLVA